MSAEHLAARAYRAIEETLSIHLKMNMTLTEAWEEVVLIEIERNLHLVKRCENANVAFVEIASDAAMAFVDIFNAEHPNGRIQPGWFYRVVQANLMQTFMPDILEKPVPRLRYAFGPGNTLENTQDTERTMREAASIHHPIHPRGGETGQNNLPLLYSHSLDKGNIQDKARNDKNTAEGSSNGSGDQSSSLNPSHDSEGHWTEEQTKQLIRMYVSGADFEACAGRLGRSEEATKLHWERLGKIKKWRIFTWKEEHHHELYGFGTSSSEGNEEGEGGREKERKKSGRLRTDAPVEPDAIKVKKEGKGE